MSKQNPFLALSDSLADAAESIAPSLVRVASRRRVATGLVWDATSVVTVARAVPRGADATITLADGSERAAKVLGRDPAADLALLQIEGEPLVPAPRGASIPRVGNLVLALGRPGQSVRATLGLVSGVGGSWTTADGARVDAFLDVDGTLPRGFSGGPLVDASGEVVGLNTSGLVRGGTTLPIPTVERVVEQLREGGDRSPGWLGVLFQPAELGPEHAALAGQANALLLTGMKRTGPAAEAGLQVGDFLVAFDGAPIAGWDDLVQALVGRSGKAGTARVLRSGELVELEVTVGERPRRGCR